MGACPLANDSARRADNIDHELEFLIGLSVQLFLCQKIYTRNSNQYNVVETDLVCTASWGS